MDLKGFIIKIVANSFSVNHLITADLVVMISYCVKLNIKATGNTLYKPN